MLRVHDCGVFPLPVYLPDKCQRTGKGAEREGGSEVLCLGQDTALARSYGDLHKVKSRRPSTIPAGSSIRHSELHNNKTKTATRNQTKPKWGDTREEGGMSTCWGVPSGVGGGSWGGYDHCLYWWTCQGTKASFFLREMVITGLFGRNAVYLGTKDTTVPKMTGNRRQRISHKKRQAANVSMAGRSSPLTTLNLKSWLLKLGCH